VNQEELKAKLDYDPETGIFTREGEIAGTITNNGYVQISINNEPYLAHRLAFLYMEGKLPKNCVDHIDRCRLDNSWTNLRHATKGENQYNKKDNNKCIGVMFSKGKYWRVRSPRIKGARIHLGHSIDFFEACCLRKSWEAANNWVAPFEGAI